MVRLDSVATVSDSAFPSAVHARVAPINRSTTTSIPQPSQQPELGTFGNVGTANVRGPGYWGLDAALARTFQIHEAQKVELRVEAFNLTNSFRMNDPTVSLNSSLFGKVTTAQDSRIMQFALKYVF